MNEKPTNYYLVFGPGVASVPDISIERFATEADAQRRRREILIAYPAAMVRIGKTNESERNG